MDIALPDELKDFIDAQVAENGFSTSSDYIRSLVEIAKVRALIDEGLNSGLGEVADDAYFERRRERIRAARAANARQAG